MRPGIFIKALLVFLLSQYLSTWPASAGAPGAESQIERTLLAYGGKERIEKARSFRLEGRVTANVRGAEGRMTRLFIRPDRLKVVVEYPGSKETRILDGSLGWRTGADGSLRPVDGYLMQSMALQAARADLPWLLLSKKDQVRPAVPLEFQGRTLPGLELTLGPGMLIRAYLDPTSHLVLRSQAVLNSPGMQTHFETDYSDFRPVDGLMVPHREENFASGVHTGTTVIERVEINPALGPDALRPE